jgi:hypothetical protein
MELKFIFYLLLIFSLPSYFLLFFFQSTSSKNLLLIFRCYNYFDLAIFDMVLCVHASMWLLCFYVIAVPQCDCYASSCASPQCKNICKESGFPALVLVVSSYNIYSTITSALQMITFLHRNFALLFNNSWIYCYKIE